MLSVTRHNPPTGMRPRASIVWGLILPGFSAFRATRVRSFLPHDRAGALS
jgi:hypothetical protein